MHRTPPCLLNAWSRHAPELKRYLDHRLGDVDEAADLLQDAFIKALRLGRGFCGVRNPRAWLFQVVRNTLTDRLRAQREHLPLSEDLPAPSNTPLSPLDRLTECLPRVLAELSEADRLALTLCDIEGQPQQALADRLGLSLPGAKSRLQRARTRLQRRLIEVCQVRFDEQGHVCCFTPRDIE
ncbi:sigma-70 family RNA polymerase sigma factor [Thermochromatium tepidum]|uniref:Sigma-70 family RNA polymerase sigma factor n=1 Tax=Thermochromatium tepidum ATCC 43061 TaxID=316276 RepID=A0A6I6E6W5_THETI|nr:sigma-70 family RNA polymerase sigma factor [Thermochromatium tepidum]QGU32258.1 sigma-70 family RNA polymerase sigma factor [Thermochromatium tepidum ATCC 43061]